MCRLLSVPGKGGGAGQGADGGGFARWLPLAAHDALRFGDVKRISGIPPHLVHVRLTGKPRLRGALCEADQVCCRIGWWQHALCHGRGSGREGPFSLRPAGGSLCSGQCPSILACAGQSTLAHSCNEAANGEAGSVQVCQHAVHDRV